MRLRVLVAICLWMGSATALAAERSVEETVGDWQVLCFDEADGALRNCYVIRDELAVLVSSAGYEMVIIGHSALRQPGSDMTVRVDGRRPIRWAENNLHADGAFETAIRQFIAGTTAVIRWHDRQSEAEERREVSLIGFTKAYRRAQEIISDLSR